MKEYLKDVFANFTCLKLSINENTQLKNENSQLIAKLTKLNLNFLLKL